VREGVSECACVPRTVRAPPRAAVFPSTFCIQRAWCAREVKLSQPHQCLRRFSAVAPAARHGSIGAALSYSLFMYYPDVSLYVRALI
jgi:hypothetical protein